MQLFTRSTSNGPAVKRRRYIVFTATLLFTVPAAFIMADLHQRTGFGFWKAIHLAVFICLFALIAFGAVQALVGYLVRRRGGDEFSIMRSVDFANDTGVMTVPVAIVMPICNEEVKRVIEGMRAIFQSVAATGKLPEADFFLLSDSNQPDKWVAEEASWLAMTQQLGAHGRMFYRKRRHGINKKAGNVADFCRRWGKHYRYMVVLDADSIMSGDAIVKLVRMMERNRRVALIQAVPQLVNGETILARLQQFATSLYGRLFTTGLNFWQQSEANYWGHNAIIRLAPFMRHCSLPEIPGDGPFGGRILSHDYVEAALLRRAGWQVWLASDIDGSFEECPGNIIDLAKRDRRWLQGNLQHAKLIFARGFHAVNRLHFSLGILAYLASPLWLTFLVLSAVIAWQNSIAGVSIIEDSTTGGQFDWVLRADAAALFIGTLILLFLPKVLALLDLRGDPAAVASFGGWKRLIQSVLLETAIFTLLAPVLMLFHSKFVALTLARRSISWGSQRRGKEGDATLSEAVSAHLDQTLIGIATAFIVYRISPGLAAWMSPVLLGLILSIPLSYVTGSLGIGQWFRSRGLFSTPIEAESSPEIDQVNRVMAKTETGRAVPKELQDDYALLQATLDPYVNAVHLALLRAKEDVTPAGEVRFVVLRQKLLQKGPAALTTQEKMALLSDPDSMNALHDEVWSKPASSLAEWWRQALAYYNVVGPRPETAFSRAA